MKHEKISLSYRIRKAQHADIPDIQALFADSVEAGLMLPRSKNNMQEGIQDWRVASTNDEIIGCVSLVFFNQALCEIRSLAVAEAYRKNGLGKKLVEAALDLAKERGAEEVFTLTRAPLLFEHFDFQKDDLRNFPEKVQKDCQTCPFITCCDEEALHHKIKERKHD